MQGLKKHRTNCFLAKPSPQEEAYEGLMLWHFPHKQLAGDGKEKNRNCWINVHFTYLGLWFLFFFFVGVVDSRKLSGTFRNCNKFDNWRDEGTMVAQALTGNECNSSWVDTGVCSTEPRHQHPKQWQSASSADFWLTLNRGEYWLAEWQNSNPAGPWETWGPGKQKSHEVQQGEMQSSASGVE